MTADFHHFSSHGILSENVCATAEVLGPAWYFTGYTGKWNCGGDWPLREDESSFWWFDDSTNPTTMSRGFERFYGNLSGGGNYFNTHLADEKGLRELSSDFYTKDAYTTAAIEMIEKAVILHRPFVVYVCFYAPHSPLIACEGDRERYCGHYMGRWGRARVERYERLVSLGLLDPSWGISPRDKDTPPLAYAPNKEWGNGRMATYAAIAERADRNVGRLVEQLCMRGLLDDTLIVIVYDNRRSAECASSPGNQMWFTRDGRPVRFGNDPSVTPDSADTYVNYGLPWANLSNTPFRRFKHYSHEGGISTPFVAHWLAVIVPGGVRYEICHFMDLKATLYDVAKLDYEAVRGERSAIELESESLRNLLAGRSWQRSRPLGFEHECNCALRYNDLKLVRSRFGDWELYDMTKDRTEGDDLSTRYPEQTRAMVKRFEELACRCAVLPYETILLMDADNKHRNKI